jgi:hypothetical protein
MTLQLGERLSSSAAPRCPGFPIRFCPKTSELKRFFGIGYKYVGSLKPKAARKKTAKKISNGAD